MATEQRRLVCACGWEIRGSEAEVIAGTQEHARRLHNMTASREEVLERSTAVPGDDPDAGPSVG